MYQYQAFNPLKIFFSNFFSLKTKKNRIFFDFGLALYYFDIILANIEQIRETTK